MKKIFIDGRAGTTGLRIEKRLAARRDLELLALPEHLRKDTEARRTMRNAADVVFLCLPDDAAREAALLVENPATVVIDASTAHRTAPGWAYGFPELSAAHRDAICAGKRIAVPGCHAGGFVALVHPLVQAGLLAKASLLHCFSLTGYSGGGKSMIAEYEADSRARGDALAAPKQYAIAQAHKHLPEMQRIPGLDTPPVFCPIVADYDCGMEVTVPLHGAQLRPAARRCDLLACYQSTYGDAALVRVTEAPAERGASALRGKDWMEITVAGNDDRPLLLARFDNLGKGASGAAVQCMNLALGAEETAGLTLENFD
ncbi:MAG: N-acetyl-gamma-glutamyl-phosphate reductase [Oscillospiraceae bacterium]|jgi:N-acetyl-gamma-glutamyl-phosphate reductase|nr:N-acetyl-gamma-glutamyl-phosphate reductase [Oscillospiraceae bacterium]